MNAKLDDEQRASVAPSVFRTRMAWILGAAVAWRLAMVLLAPSISRDGVTFCWLARDLGRQGTAVLRSEDVDQHPLFSLCVLAVERVVTAVGAPESPQTWQACGRGVALFCGALVVLLAAALCRRVAQIIGPELDSDAAACWGALLTAVLPLNVALSADPMSDQLHLALYLAGLLLMLRMTTVRQAAVVGVTAGLAFLTRPEGGALLAGGLSMLLAARGVGVKRSIARGVALVAAFVALAAPYWLTVGELTPKKNPLEWLSSEPSAALVDPCVVFARLEKKDVGYAAAPWVAYQTLRAGRVVIPLLAIVALVALRKRVNWRLLAGPAACLMLHFAFCAVLLKKHGYLNPRHTLVLIAILTPFAALAMVGLREALRAKGLRRLWPWCAAALVAPLAIYALRVPNAQDAYLPEAGRFLATRIAGAPGKTLMGESVQRRTAFYADARWIAWYPNREVADALPKDVRWLRPDYLAVEVGPGGERAGNEADVAALESQADLQPIMKRVYDREVERDEKGHVARLLIFEFDWPEYETNSANSTTGGA